MRRNLLSALALAFSTAACSTQVRQPVMKAGEVNRSETTGFSKPGSLMLLDSVVITPAVQEGFQFLYAYITEVEFVLCLEGARRGGRLVINGFRLAKMEAMSVNSVRYKPCTSEHYVGTAHNHPPTHDGKDMCHQSEPDQLTFGIDNRAVVDIVLCGRNQIYLVSKTGEVRTFSMHKPYSTSQQ